MRLTSRRSDDDADVIRARLRLLLDDAAGPGAGAPGWVPDDLDQPLERATPEDAHPDPVAPAWAWRLPPVLDPLDGEAGSPDAGTALPSGIGRHRAPGAAVRVDPGRRGTRALWLAGVVGALALVACTWLARPQVQPVPAQASAAATLSSPPRAPGVGEAARTSKPVVVSVVGKVARPGLVTLPAGARVADAIEAAGGLLPGTDLGVVNLAAVVTDGQQVAVAVPGAVATGSGGPAAGPVDLNLATAGDLDALPGIGPVLAQRIVSYRQQHGAFTTVEQLSDVPGIGPALYAQLAPLVRV